jgi:hypothetical protein
MKNYLLGYRHGTREAVRMPKTSFDTHWHLIGGTGKGKTTALHTLLHQLLLDPSDHSCAVIIDLMGNLSYELLLWLASPDFCTDEVRERLIYIEPAREDVAITFNPLQYDTPAHGYYKVGRACNVILRGWSSQNLEEMPRLARWMVNAFLAAAALQLTIIDCAHFLMPSSRHHGALLQCLPEQLQLEWDEIRRSRPGDVSRLLESTRNRLKPFFESPVLRQMFGSTVNRLDMARFMREGKIVLINLAPYNRLPEQISDAIGGLVINEVLATARSLPLGVRYPTYLLLDEFQRFVGRDLESAIPEVRQLGIKLLLSHQSLSQLKRGDTDLTSLIFQCQSRMIFGLQGEDADILAHELASLQFNPWKIKDEQYVRRQRLIGHRIIELASWSTAEADSESWGDQNARSTSRSERMTATFIPSETVTKGESSGWTKGTGHTRTRTEGGHQALLPVHEEYWERANRVFQTFDEDRHVWGRDIRQLTRGRAFLRLVDHLNLYDIDVKRSAPSYLGLDFETLRKEFPEVLDAMHQLVERNFQSELFTSPVAIEREIEERIARVTGGRIVLPAPHTPALPPPQSTSGGVFIGDE